MIVNEKKIETTIFYKKDFDSLNEFRKWQLEQTVIQLDKFVFRGVSKSESYKLIPSALRKNENGKIKVLDFHPAELSSNLMPETIGNIVVSEFNLLCKFAKEANKQGLFIPDKSIITKSYLQNHHINLHNEISKWYYNDILDLAALAQHNGILTRMLDWTFDINVAIFFALEDRVKDIISNDTAYSTNEPYAIWGVNPNFIMELCEGLSECRCPVRFHIPNYWGNNNVHFQKGLLSYEEITNFNNVYSNTYEVKSFDEHIIDYLEEINKKHHNISNDGFQLFKITINSDVNQTKNEFEQIIKSGYSASSIYSGYAGVKQKIDEDIWIKSSIFY